MAKLLYSFHTKSERAYLCKQGHIHSVNNHEVACEDDEYEELLKEFPDSLSEVPWENINNQWVKGTPKSSRAKPQLSLVEEDN